MDRYIDRWTDGWMNLDNVPSLQGHFCGVSSAIYICWLKPEEAEAKKVLHKWQVATSIIKNSGKWIGWHSRVHPPTALLWAICHSISLLELRELVARKFPFMWSGSYPRLSHYKEFNVRMKLHNFSVFFGPTTLNSKADLELVKYLMN